MEVRESETIVGQSTRCFWVCSRVWWCRWRYVQSVVSVVRTTVGSRISSSGTWFRSSTSEVWGNFYPLRDCLKFSHFLILVDESTSKMEMGDVTPVVLYPVLVTIKVPTTPYWSDGDFPVSPHPLSSVCLRRKIETKTYTYSKELNYD